MIRMDAGTKSKRELEENPHALLRIYVRTRAPAGQWESEKWKCREIVGQTSKGLMSENSLRNLKRRSSVEGARFSLARRLWIMIKKFHLFRFEFTYLLETTFKIHDKRALTKRARSKEWTTSSPWLIPLERVFRRGSCKIQLRKWTLFRDPRIRVMAVRAQKREC